MITNFEKYKDEILSLHGDFRFDIPTASVRVCNRDYCDTCLFNKGCDCCSQKVRWLYKGAKLVLNDRECIFLESIRYPDYTYIVRFKTGSLCMCMFDKPYKHTPDMNWDIYDNVRSKWFDIDEDLFPFITSEDDQPWSVKDLLLLKDNRKII